METFIINICGDTVADKLYSVTLQHHTDPFNGLNLAKSNACADTRSFISSTLIISTGGGGGGGGGGGEERLVQSRC